MTTAADLLTLLGALIVVIGGTCGYWAWREARDQALLRECIAALRESREQLTRPPLADSKQHLLAGIDHAIVVLEDHLTYSGTS